MLKSVAETVLSLTRAAFARVAIVESSTNCPAVFWPLNTLQPLARRTTAVMATVLIVDRIQTPVFMRLLELSGLYSAGAGPGGRRGAARAGGAGGGGGGY